MFVIYRKFITVLLILKLLLSAECEVVIISDDGSDDLQSMCTNELLWNCGQDWYGPIDQYISGIFETDNDLI